MVVVKRLKEASLCIILALFSMLVSVIFFFIAFSSDVWVKKDYDETYEINSDTFGVTNFFHTGTRIYGLWKYTRHYPWNEQPKLYEDRGLLLKSDELPLTVTVSGWYRATQAMECLGLISIVLALLTILLYVCVPSCKVKRALYLMIIFTFAAVFFIVIGIAIFGARFDEIGFEVGWSMGLAIGAAILVFISGIFQILELT